MTSMFFDEMKVSHFIKCKDDPPELESIDISKIKLNFIKFYSYFHLLGLFTKTCMHYSHTIMPPKHCKIYQIIHPESVNLLQNYFINEFTASI